jgi:HEAT repeats
MTGDRRVRDTRTTHAPRASRTDGGSVWRRSGEAVFGFLTFIVLVSEAVMLGLLVWALLFEHGSSAPGALGLGTILVGAVSLTAILIAVVTVSVILVRSASTRREERRTPAIAAWRGRWEDVLAGLAECPEPPPSREAVEALLQLREDASATEAEPVASLVVASGAGAVLLARLDAVVEQLNRAWPLRLTGRSHRLGNALDTLDDLARARLPEGVDPLLPLLDSGERAIRTMSLRAVARSIASLDVESDRDHATNLLLEHLRLLEVDRGALEEAILLLEDAAAPLVSSVLASTGEATALTAASLDAAHRLHIDVPAPALAGLLDVDQALEVRAAAFRVLGGLRSLPPEAGRALRAGLHDEAEAVRIHATRAARLLPPDEAVRALDSLLGDPSWWVRRAAAETLPTVPGRGLPALADAARRHPDPFGRQMAAQVARDRGLVVGPGTVPERRSA